MVASIAQGAGAQVVEVQLRLVAEAHPDETTVPPDSILEACLGAEQFIEIRVTNTGADPPGIAGGTVDVLFDFAAAGLGSIDHGTLFDELTTGEIDQNAGIVDNLGGVTLQPGIAVAPSWALLGRIAFTATAKGAAVFSLEPGAFQFALAGGHPPLDFEQDVALGPAQILQVVSPVVVGDMDCDDDIDLDDLAVFHTCVTGPASPGDPVPLPALCTLADFDADGDVDFTDFGVFQLRGSGPLSRRPTRCGATHPRSMGCQSRRMNSVP